MEDHNAHEDFLDDEHRLLDCPVCNGYIDYRARQRQAEGRRPDAALRRCPEWGCCHDHHAPDCDQVRAPGARRTPGCGGPTPPR